MADTNGHAKTTATLTLTMDLLTHTMKVGGEFPTLDCALAMLEQAKRALETQYRVETMRQLQEQAKEQQINQAIAGQIQRRL